MLKALVAEKPDRFLPELTAELNKRTEATASPSSVGRALSRLGVSRKKMTLSAVEKDRPDVVARTEAFKREIASIDPRDLFFVDEAGSNIAMTRTHARSAVGERVHAKVPRCRGTVTTVLAALTITGIAAVATIEGATDANVFKAFAEQTSRRSCTQARWSSSTT